MRFPNRNRMGLIGVGALLLLAGGASAGWQASQKRSTYTDVLYGYTLQPPKFPVAAPGGATVVAAFSGPVVNGFAANMNVVVIPAKMTLQQYRDTTLASLQQLRLRVTKQTEGKQGVNATILFEYEGDLNGRLLNFLSKAVVGPNHVWVGTCTAPSASFKDYEAEFRVSLDSLAPSAP